MIFVTDQEMLNSVKLSFFRHPLVIRCAIADFDRGSLNAPNSFFFKFVPRDLESWRQDRESMYPCAAARGTLGHGDKIKNPKF